MNEFWGIITGVILTIGTGLFVASEFALVNLDRPELEQRRARGERRLGPTISALKITSTHLSSAQLGITLTTLLAGYTFEPAISSLLRDPLLSIGVPEAAVTSVGAVVAIVLATLFSMILGELIPKNFALAVPLATAKVVVPFQIAFTFVFKPIILFLNGTANRIIRSMGIEPKEELSGARTAEELSFLVQRSAFEGMLDQDEAVMLHRTLSFSSHTAEQVMTPRVQVTMVPRTASAHDVIETAIESGLSRFPVMGDDVDDIIGVVHVKSAYAVELERLTYTSVTQLMSETVKVPENTGVGSLLEVLRTRSFQMAIVVDEYGGTSGIVTLEDLVEELLGEVRDEHDEPTNDITVFDDAVLFPASLRPDELWERAGIRVPEGPDYDTVAGYILDQLERIPDLGESLPLTYGNLIIEEIDGTRITLVRYVTNNHTEDPAFAGSRTRMLDTFHEGATS